MHKISAELKKSLSQEVTTIATCFELSLKDQRIFGFTNIDVDLEIGGIKYLSQSGFYPSSLHLNNKHKSDHFEVLGVLDSNTLSEKEIMAGVYDGAKFKIFLVDYLNLLAGSVILKTGFISSIEIKGNQFIAKTISLMQSLDREIGALYSPLCRAKFGDEHCKMCKSDFTFFGKIEEVLSPVLFKDSTRNESENYFQFGEIEFQTGANKSEVFDIRSSKENVIELMLPASYTMQKGDSYKIVRGCDKQFSTCINKYNNALNFRGEPHVPEPSRLTLW